MQIKFCNILFHKTVDIPNNMGIVDFFLLPTVRICCMLLLTLPLSYSQVWRTCSLRCFSGIYYDSYGIVKFTVFLLAQYLWRSQILLLYVKRFYNIFFAKIYAVVDMKLQWQLKYMNAVAFRLLSNSFFTGTFQVEAVSCKVIF